MDRPTKKINVRIFTEDLDTIKASYPDAGYNKIIRALLSEHCRKLRAKARNKLDTEPLEMETI